MKDKFYAVKNGRNPGIYLSWNECNSQISGYKNAEHKSFNSLIEARSYLGLSTSNYVSTPPTLIAYIGVCRHNDTLGFGIVYTDHDTGAIDVSNGSFSCRPVKKVAKWAPYFLACYYAIERAIYEQYQQILICTKESDLEWWTQKCYGKYTHIANQFKDYISTSQKNIKIIFHVDINSSWEQATQLATCAAEKRENYIYQIPLL